MRRGLRFVPPALLLTAVAEIVVFVLLARGVGLGVAVSLTLAVSLLGVVLLRREGIRAWRGFRAAMADGRPPGDQVTDGLLGLSAGVLLAAPGLVTGVAGLLLVLPPVRSLARRGVRTLTERRISSAAAGDLFGPRRVRVYRGEPADGGGPPSPGPAGTVPPHAGGTRPSGGASTSPAGGSPAIEGEIVEPRRG